MFVLISIKEAILITEISESFKLMSCQDAGGSVVEELGNKRIKVSSSTPRMEFIEG